MSQIELDPQFVQGLKFLRSTSKDSADQLRTLLDDMIKQKYGPSKMLCNVLQKKYTMEEPVLSDNSSCSSKKSKSSSLSSKHSNKSSKSDSPEDVVTRVDTPTDLMASDDPLAEILEDDLTCVVCKGMDVGARNRLVECDDCHSLYHQECHTPTIQDTLIDVPKSIWYCSGCIKNHQPPKEKGSPKPQVEGKKESKKSSSKHSEKHKGSSRDNASESLQKVTPTINIMGAKNKESTRKAKDKRSTSSSTKYSSSSSKNSGDKYSSKSKTNSSD